MLVDKREPTQISGDNYSYLQREVYRNSGIVLDETKQYLLEARLMPIVKRENLQTINDLCALMRATSKPQIVKDITEAMTTNETLFFRDSAPFKAMQEKLIPELLNQRKATKTLRFWSAASSSGQEPYSLAMLLLEMGLEDWKIEILGTDISDQMVERARSGKYMQIEVNRGLPAPYLVKYFQRHGLEWQLKDQVLKFVKFKQFDLRQPINAGPFDFVFCRNVLIYFDVETKKKILKQIANVMNHGATLVLGAAETTMGLSTSFERFSMNGANFYRNAGK